MKDHEKRWIATIGYRHDDGTRLQHHFFDELEELHDIVEAGPNWYAIAAIVVALNPERRAHFTTVEQARLQ